MSEAFEYAEHRATLPGDCGIECTFYERLNARTFDLREGLYVTVEADGHDFRPSGLVEHFPRSELVGYQACNSFQALGKGKTLEVVFRFYSPTGSGFAEEGARIVAAALEGLEERLGASEWSRSMAAGVDGRRVGRKLLQTSLQWPPKAPYRPPPGALSARLRVPQPPPKPAQEHLPSFGEMFRGGLERWGVLEDFDRMQAASFRPAPRRKLEEQRGAFDDGYERTGG